MHKCYFHYLAMPMVTSQILKFVDFRKTQKSRYLDNKTFFSQIKIFLNHSSRATSWPNKKNKKIKKKFCSGGNHKYL